MQTWRDFIRPIVADIIKEFGVEDEKGLRRVLREKYPFDRPPHGWVYKVWLSEINIQLGKKKYGERKYQPPPKEQLSFLENK